MTSKPLREVRRLATLDHQRQDDEAAERAAWGSICEDAYRIMRNAVPVLELEGVTALEPVGHVDGVFEWRTYWHSSDGFDSVYVVIRETPAPVPAEGDR